LSAATNKTLVQQLEELLGHRFPRALTKWEEYIPLPTGISLLDHGLLHGGLPRGRLTEIVGSKSSGKTSLIFHILAGLNQKEGNVAYFDFSQSFYPPTAQKGGVDLKKVLILRPQNIQAGLRAAEILFRNESICMTIFDLVGTMDEIPRALLLRLKKGIKKVRGVGIFLREPDSTGIPNNQLALSLKVEKKNRKLLVKIEKSPFSEKNQKVELVLDE
jgi:hypothetical protein